MTPPKHAEERLLRLKIYAQTCMHILIHIYIHACVYLYIYTCRNIHICMFVYTYIHMYTHTYNMYICTYTNDGAAGTVWEARLDATPLEAPHFSSRSNSTSSLRRDPFDEKRRVSAGTNATDSSSSHHHNSAPPRLQPLICTGAEPPSSWPVQTAGGDPPRSHFCHFRAFSNMPVIAYDINDGSTMD